MNVSFYLESHQLSQNIAKHQERHDMYIGAWDLLHLLQYTHCSSEWKQSLLI